MNHAFLKLCLVTHCHHSLESCQQFLDLAVSGGVTSVQLRLKGVDPADYETFARAIKLFLDERKIPLIINDHVTLAKAIEASGVHLGQSDMAPLMAREILGPDKIIGWSIETLADLDRANALACLDYVAASAVFPSRTKTDCKTIWGVDGLKKIVARSMHPVVAIGGIEATNAADVIATGVAGIAVVSAIHEASDPAYAAKKLMSFYRGKKHVV
ncbi:MAG TPA: thiamine phosphate synthase [Gammaproteobacteria bacterium]|nr:thiamine phosphate synthase [Gammaproteobacteria bacterium]